MGQGNRLSPSGETESAAYSESLVPTTATGEGALQLRSCVDPEFYSGSKGSGAGGHKGPFVQLVLVLLRIHRPAPRDHPQRPAHRGQPERGWLSSEGVGLERGVHHCITQLRGCVLTAVRVNCVHLCPAHPLPSCSTQPCRLEAVFLVHGTCWEKPSADLIAGKWGSKPGASAPSIHRRQAVPSGQTPH